MAPTCLGTDAQWVGQSNSGEPGRQLLGVRCRRLVKRRVKEKAIVAAGNSILTIVWSLLSDSDARYHDLGAATTTPTSTNIAGHGR